MRTKVFYFIATVLFAFFLIATPVFAYHSELDISLLGFSYKLSQDTHSEITSLAYTAAGIASGDYPDLAKGDLRAEIFEGDSDEAMAHQGSDQLAQAAGVGRKQNEFAWFGAPDLQWRQVLEDYRNKRFKEAYHRIGVLLHLTEDATVPAHVRITPHGRGSEHYFGTGKTARTDAQPTYKNNRVPWGLDLYDTVQDDLFEQVVENLAANGQIQILAIKPMQLPSPDVYMDRTKEAIRKYLDNDSYWDQYWSKNNNFNTWGSYGPNGNNFGKGKDPLDPKESRLIIFAYNTAIANTAGQVQVISKKLPPIAENLALMPTKFGEEGTKISFTILENRTNAVRIKLTVGASNGPRIIDDAGQVYDGRSTFDLNENQGVLELPFAKTFTLNWNGNMTGGKDAAGSGRVFLEVVDGDGNHSEVLTGNFEFQRSGKKPLIPDQVQKNPMIGKAPIIGQISNTQLHGSFEETPHRYLLQVLAKDPEGGELTYNWSINCGYFVGDQTSLRIEWRYNTPGECAEALTTVIVKDPDGLSTKKTQAVF